MNYHDNQKVKDVFYSYFTWIFIFYTTEVSIKYVDMKLFHVNREMCLEPYFNEVLSLFSEMTLSINKVLVINIMQPLTSVVTVCHF